MPHLPRAIKLRSCLRCATWRKRAGHLLGIHKALRILFPRDRDLAYRWVMAPNRRFGDRPPLETMRQGFGGILAIRRYLDFEREREEEQ